MVGSSKKNGPYTFSFEIAQKTFTFGESRTLCQFTFPDRWKVASSLKIRESAKPSTASLSCISMQKLRRTSLSFSLRSWCSWSLYDLHFSLLRRIRHTVDCAAPNSKLARVVQGMPSGILLEIVAAQVQRTRFLPIRKQKITAHVYWTPYLLLLSPSGESGQLCTRAIPYPPPPPRHPKTNLGVSLSASELPRSVA